jgi:hypothetical protein
MSRHMVQGFVIALLLAGCGVVPESVSKDDERLRPLWVAIDRRADRSSLGFTEIPPDARIQLEGRAIWGRDYDAMLHIYSKTSRTVAFRKVGSDYEWIGEQESHQGPKDYTCPDGTFKEHITITYETQHVSGFPLNTVSVVYWGDDPRLANRSNLSLEDIAPVLQEWSQAR